MHILQLQNLSKNYSGNYVLKGINLTVDQAQIIGYIGPNGAGKSTTIKILTGIIDSFEGEATVPGCMLMATLNALFVKYFLSLYIIFFGICLYIWKLPVVDDFLFGLTNNYLCLLTGVIIVDKYLPFSRPPSTREQSGRGILMMLLMIIIAVMVGIHYLISKIPGALYVFFPVEIFLCWLIRRELRNLPWKKISV